MKYARVLLEHSPQPATKIFIDYYTGRYRPRRKKEEPIKIEKEAHGVGPTVQNLAALLPLPFINTNKPGAAKAAAVEPQVATEIEEPLAYDVPKPRSAFSSFVDHPEEFIAFLEALIEQENLKEEDKVDLYTTLFEMYLDAAKRKKDPTEKQEWEEKAKKLIQGKEVKLSRLNTYLKATLIRDRYLYRPPMCYCSPICPISRKVQPS